MYYKLADFAETKLSAPASNSECERSMNPIRKLHTDSRACLGKPRLLKLNYMVRNEILCDEFE